jgi:NAD(P)H-nitrite reductase large subunit
MAQTEKWYSDRGVQLELSSNEKRLQVDKQLVTVGGLDSSKADKILGYKHLVLAMGARSMTAQDLSLVNSEAKNVFSIREVREAEQLVNLAESGTIKKMVVVGGGFIGMEASAAFAGWPGIDVTLVFPDSNKLLDKLFPGPIAKVFEAHLVARGVKIHRGSVKSLKRSEQDSALVHTVVLSNGDEIETDALIIAVGAKLNSEIAQDCLEQASSRTGGIVVNRSFQTNYDTVYAIGDLAALDGKRFESVDFCRASAKRAAESIAAGGQTLKTSWAYLPHFYSRLFEYTANPVIFKFYGDSSVGRGVVVEEFGNLKKATQCGPDEEMPPFGAMWYKDGAVNGILLCNASEDQYKHARQAIVDGVTVAAYTKVVQQFT